MSSLKRSDGAIVGLLVAFLLAVLVLYPASVGPACAAVNHGYLSEQTVETAYAPIVWLAGRSDAVHSVGNWWISLWESL
jgi:hypothetical protein